MPVDEVGKEVQAGDPLFRVDDRQLQAQLAVQQANLAAAKAQLAKLERDAAAGRNPGGRGPRQGGRRQRRAAARTSSSERNKLLASRSIAAEEHNISSGNTKRRSISGSKPRRTCNC